VSRQSYTVDPVRAAQARIEKRLSQVSAASALGVNRVTLNKIENGKANVSLDLLERMAGEYGRSRDWLLGKDDVDPVAANRDRISKALQKIAEGFEELDLVNVLNAQASLAASETEQNPEVEVAPA
jgi:transcriptional regulator with XRE-family HTH domain